MLCPTLNELPPPPGKTGWLCTEESPQLPDTMPDPSTGLRTRLRPGGSLSSGERWHAIVQAGTLRSSASEHPIGDSRLNYPGEKAKAMGIAYIREEW